jgi:hypothetical protein
MRWIPRREIDGERLPMPPRLWIWAAVVWIGFALILLYVTGTIG